jgi:nicotinamidase-related amidase
MRVVHLPGARAESVVVVQPGDLVCRRPALGGFTGTDLALLLSGIGATDLLIAGFPLELGADCTMREANDLGYECLLLEDCCTSLSDQTEAGAISSVQMSGGIFGAVAASTDVLAVLAISS